jgi:hypothetical protein
MSPQAAWWSFTDFFATRPSYFPRASFLCHFQSVLLFLTQHCPVYPMTGVFCHRGLPLQPLPAFRNAVLPTIFTRKSLGGVGSCKDNRMTMAHVQVTEVGEGLQVWRVPANLLNKQSGTADKGWSSGLGTCQEPITFQPHPRNYIFQNVTRFSGLASSCEHRNEPSGSVKARNSLTSRMCC